MVRTCGAVVAGSEAGLTSVPLLSCNLTICTRPSLFVYGAVAAGSKVISPFSPLVPVALVGAVVVGDHADPEHTVRDRHRLGEVALDRRSVQRRPAGGRGRFGRSVAPGQIGQAGLTGDDHLLGLAGEQPGHRVVAHRSLEPQHGIGGGGRPNRRWFSGSIRARLGLRGGSPRSCHPLDAVVSPRPYDPAEPGGQDATGGDEGASGCPFAQPPIWSSQQSGRRVRVCRGRLTRCIRCEERPERAV